MGTEAAQAAPGAEKRPRATTPRRETWRTWIDGRSLKGGAGLAAGAALLGAPPAAPRRLRQPNDALASTAAGELPADLKESDFEFSIVEREPITEFAAEETYDIVVVGAGCAGVPAVLTAVEEGAKVACLQKEATVSANGNGCSFVVKAHSNPAGIVRWRSDWARLNDWRINNELFNYYVEYAEEAVPWVISARDARSASSPSSSSPTAPSATTTAASSPCATPPRPRTRILWLALAQKAAEGGATFYYETPCVQLVQEEDGTVTGRHRQAKGRQLRQAQRHQGRRCWPPATT